MLPCLRTLMVKEQQGSACEMPPDLSPILPEFFDDVLVPIAHGNSNTRGLLLLPAALWEDLQMNRVVVVGTSGSGKTAFARSLALEMSVPQVEMDAIFHRGGWSATPDDAFRAEVMEFAKGSAWVADGNYTSHWTREVLWPRAETFVWLDLPRRVVVTRVIRRTLRRVVTREQLWDGVSEPWSNLYSADPHRNIMLWAWTTFHHNREKFRNCLEDGTWSHADVSRLTSTDAVERFLSSARVSGLCDG